MKERKKERKEGRKEERKVLESDCLEKATGKVHKGTFWSNGNIVYLLLISSYTDVYKYSKLT
jgi:hypothetical protein